MHGAHRRHAGGDGRGRVLARRHPGAVRGPGQHALQRGAAVVRERDGGPGRRGQRGRAGLRGVPRRADRGSSRGRARHRQRRRGAGLRRQRRLPPPRHRNAGQDRRGGPPPPLALLHGSAAAACAVLLALSVIESFSLTAVALFLLGFASVISAAGCNTALQLGSSDELRGRVMGLYALIHGGSFPIAAPLIGAVAERWSVSPALFGWGAGGLAPLAVLPA